MQKLPDSNVRMSDLRALLGGRAGDSRTYFLDYFPGKSLAADVDYSANQEASAIKSMSMIRGKGPMKILSTSSPSSSTISWTGVNYSQAQVQWPGLSSNIPFGIFTFFIPDLPINVPKSVTVKPVSASGKIGSIAPAAIDVVNTVAATATPTAPAFRMSVNINPRFSFQLHLLANTADGTPISSFKGYSGTGTQRPVYYATGGYNNRPYLRFLSGNPTLFTNPTATTYNLNIGLTFVFLMKPTEDGTANKNNYARFASTFFTGGGYVEVFRVGTTNNVGIVVYGGDAYPGTAQTTVTNTNAALVTNQWGLYIFRYTNSNRNLEIKYKNLPTASAITKVSAITDFVSNGTVSGTGATLVSLVSNSSNSWCTYVNTSLAVPAVDFGGGYVFHQVLSDNDIVEISNTLLEDSAIGALNEYPPPAGTIAADTWTKLAGETVTGIGGVTYRKYQMTVSGQPYGNGVYKAWANTILLYSNSSAYNTDEWPPSGPFDKREAATKLRAGWHIATKFMSKTGADAATPAILVIELPGSIKILKYTLQSRTDGFLNQMPSKWEVQGSADGSSWTTVDSRINFFNWMVAVTREFDVELPGFYSQYRIVVYQSGGSDDMHIGEWRLFGL